SSLSGGLLPAHPDGVVRQRFRLSHVDIFARLRGDGLRRQRGLALDFHSLRRSESFKPGAQCPLVGPLFGARISNSLRLPLTERSRNIFGRLHTLRIFPAVLVAERLDLSRKRFIGAPLAIHLRLVFALAKLLLARHPSRHGEELPLRFCFQSLFAPLSEGRCCGLEMGPTCPIPVMARRRAGHPAASALLFAIEKNL